MTWIRIVCAALVLVGCGSGVQQPTFAPPPERPGTVIATSAGRAWDAVVAHFAEQSVPIATIDRSSGLIVTAPMLVPSDSLGVAWAWCGTVYRTDGGRGPEYQALGATAGTYNVLVRGDSASSEVRIRATWSRNGSPTRCQSKDQYERELEAAIQRRAQATGSR